MSDAQLYDPDNYLIQEHRSPGLEALKPSFDVVETPPPIATRDSSLEPSEDEEGEGGGAHKESSDEKHQGDYVLLRQWAPNHPAIANTALKRYIGPSSRVQEEVFMTVIDDNQHGADATATQVEEDDATGWDLIDTPEAMETETPVEHPKVNGFHSPPPTSDPKELARAPSLTKRLNLKPPLRPPPINTSSTEEDSIAKSPALARFTINAADGDPLNTLPAMQMSPPRSSVTGSPEPRQNLPSLTSLTTALSSDSGTPFSASSPPLSRTSPGQLSQYGPSPHSGMSPPSLPSHPSFWRTSTREGSTSTPSDYAIVSASGSVSTPASSIIHQSPILSHPNPITHSPDHSRLDGSTEQIVSPDSDEADANGTDQFGCSSYKCTISGCTAVPFQTQYLLNSHMNVHSDTRPHFCPVKGCNRGPGGQGFKRKNEMIRYVFPVTPQNSH